MSDTIRPNDPQQDQSHLEQLVREGSSFETILRRLRDQGEHLRQGIRQLNTERTAVFGSVNMAILGRARVRTEQNAIARDVIQLGQQLLFGFNLQLGLRKTLSVDDVFVLYHLDEQDDQFELTAINSAGTFLADGGFLRDFNELQQYYSQAFLSQLIRMDGKLLAVFQIGEKVTDIRVFRWELYPNGSVNRYIDNRGERDLKFPDRFGFKWQVAGRDRQVQGRQPHLNILDTIFVDNLRGDITVKIENNTSTGQGIFSDPVEIDSQSLDDASFEYADLGSMIVLRILPFTETTWRYYIYNRDTQTVLREDQLAGSIVPLPENHGLIFPAGFYLSTGELKTYDIPDQDFRFVRSIRAPNGEDVLFAFFAQKTGHVLLYRYNLISKQTDTPMIGHGYALHDSGRLAIFHAEDEPTQVHPLQLWHTPFMADRVHAEQADQNQHPLGKIGNPELVRGIAELNTIIKLIEQPTGSALHFHRLIKTIDRTLDQCFWLDDLAEISLQPQLIEARQSAELMIDEYDKVQAIRQQSNQAIDSAATTQAQLLRDLKPNQWKSPDAFVSYLKILRDHHGQLMTLKDRRYIDLERLQQLEQALQQAQDDLTVKTFDFLASEQALDGYRNTLAELSEQVRQAERREQLATLVERYRELTQGLDMIQSMLASMSGDNTTQQTQIADNISSIYASINQQRAHAEVRLREQGSAEARAQFAARMRLYEQSLANGINALTGPEDCDPLLTRMLDQLQELESQFGEFDDFLALILAERERSQESIEARRQQLQEQRQRRINTLSDASTRILQNIRQRTERFGQLAELHAFFASDAMVQKVRQMAEQLREMGASLEADSAASQLRAAQDGAMRSVRDRADIFEDGGQVIKLGPRHRFSVNQQQLDLTLLVRDSQPMLHLTGTQFYEPLHDARLTPLQAYWDINLPSESPQVYRAEYLAYLVMQQLLIQQQGKPQQTPINVADLAALTDYIRQFASPRYQEGYEKGIHDTDAALIVSTLWPAQQQAGLLRYSPTARAIAMLYWSDLNQPDNSEKDKAKTDSSEQASSLLARCRSAGTLKTVLGSDHLQRKLSAQLLPALHSFCSDFELPASSSQISQAADYLVQQLANGDSANSTLSSAKPSFVISQYASDLVSQFKQQLSSHQREFEQALSAAKGQHGLRWQITAEWLRAFAEQLDQPAALHYLPEAIALINQDNTLLTQTQHVKLSFEISGLIGQHPRIHSQTLSLQLDEFAERLDHHQHVVMAGWQQLQQVRQVLLQEQRERLRLDEYTPKPLSSFVRNKLISESYLPLIGDNLAKQIGTVGENRRTDLMGLLMMISPPGYGKTTLMEYVASRLGLIFMKINCPSLGHEVTSLDPERAPHSTARAELIKLNLALEMGNNVMLYLDDIQHTNPEFLQKFISLCDGSRRIEGIWQGRTQTYDLRGKRFCVAMAGNPYTESGEVFKIPDMLANRADIYNLGDVLSGMEDVFALSYIENAISSSPILAPLATRGMDDFYRFADLARGREVASTDFEHDYSAAERQDIVNTLQNLYTVRDTVLKVNQAYIASSAQADAYRTEPNFRLQGSYRNMNRLAEKISPIMTAAELQRLVDDHYVGEAQLLTQGAEENLLKLKEMRGTLSPDEAKRWAEIKLEYQRRQQAGGDQDTGVKVVRQLGFIAEGLNNGLSHLKQAASEQQVHHRQLYEHGISQHSASLEQAKQQQSHLHDLISQLINRLGEQLHQLDLAPNIAVNVAEPVGMQEAMRQLTAVLNQSLLALQPTEQQLSQASSINNSAKKTQQAVEDVKTSLQQLGQQISELKLSSVGVQQHAPASSPTYIEYPDGPRPPPLPPKRME